MKKEITFEEAVSELEGIVQNLESGNLSLDESISIFQRGMELSNLCSKKLDSAEKKINVLIQTKSGEFEEVSFIGEEE